MINHPKLLSVATAVPNYKFSQDQVEEVIPQVFKGPSDLLEKMMPIYKNSGVIKRYACMPMEWFKAPVGWAEKNKLFQTHALTLLEKVATRCLSKVGKAFEDVDLIVTISSSGIATPTLDALIMQKLPFRPNVQRLPIFGLGCAGGTLGLARSASMACDGRNKLVLLLVVELCSLTFRQRDISKSGLVATALFGDGAAAALISCQGNGPDLIAWGEHTWPNTLDIMGWNVMDDGLAVQFSSDIPTLIKRKIPPVIADFLRQQNMNLEGINHWLCHPGGAKVLSAYENALNLGANALDFSRHTLRDYGNMSASTILFVLKRALESKIKGRSLITSLGPGFSTGFVLMES